MSQKTLGAYKAGQQKQEKNEEEEVSCEVIKLR